MVVTLAILYLTLWPDPVPDHPRLFEGADKVVHAIMFMGFYWALGVDRWVRQEVGPFRQEVGPCRPDSDSVPPTRRDVLPDVVPPTRRDVLLDSVPPTRRDVLLDVVQSNAGILIVTAAFGGLVEVLQWWMGIGRSGDTLDFVADVAGGLIGALTLNSILRGLGISPPGSLPKSQSLKSSENSKNLDI